jgi:hypothetical protein
MWLERANLFLARPSIRRIGSQRGVAEARSRHRLRSPPIGTAARGDPGGTGHLPPNLRGNEPIEQSG